MPVRNRTTRLIPDNVLGSVLRETAREARRSKRRSGATSGGAHAGAVVETDGNGQATLTYNAPVPADMVPVAVATALCSEAAIATLDSVTATQTKVTVYTITGSPVAGIDVHVAVFAAQAPTVPQ